MPASPVTVCARRGRGCPACGETRCADPVQCLHFLTSSKWGKCTECAGSGWATDSAASLFCEWCAGSGLIEYGDEGFVPTEDTTPRLTERLAARIEDLRAQVAAPLVVVA
jgi:hypothetical protein